MRNKIAELAIKEVRWGVDGIITPDPVEIGEAIANEIMGLLRQEPTMTVSIAYKHKGLVLVNDETGEWVTAPGNFDEYDRVALVLLPEEE